MLALTTGGAAAEDCPKQRSLSGADLQIIQIAMPEFARQSFDIQSYDVAVEERGDLYIVSASDPKKPQGYRGSQPGRPELSIEISKSERKVVRSYFNRWDKKRDLLLVDGRWGRDDFAGFPHPALERNQSIRRRLQRPPTINIAHDQVFPLSFWKSGAQ
jgi:hypothetical protein